jgi:exopolyphosphatase/guanosine-5'-triphosphate,3'-diphosphate pyrophosphatase
VKAKGLFFCLCSGLYLVPASGESSHCMSRDTLRLLIEKLAALPLAERRNVPGMNPDRADQIIHGAIILASVLDIVDVHRARVCRSALREGLLLEHARRQWSAAA